MKAYLPRTAAFAWAPSNAEVSGPVMATGTVAGALDESFNNDSVLELWHLNASADDTMNLSPTVASSVNANGRFNRLGWGFAHKDKPYGLLAAGLENGEVGVWDVGLMLDPHTTAQSQVLRNSMHKGSVRGLSFNQPQPNLIATGSVNAEIYVWDLKAPNKPYTPGSRSQHLDEISSLAWNGQVPYVLATASTNGCTTVWDLRHKREIAVLRNNSAPAAAAMSSARSISALAWHPLSPTRIATATEDDMNPGIVLWDLRNSRAPEAVLSGHEQGVLGLSWCRQDENLMLSCGKDSRTLCWNPQSHEIVAEMPPRSNWAFDVQWNPRNPNMLASASFDGHIIVQSLQNIPTEGEQDAGAVSTANMNPDDLFTALGNAPPPTTGGVPLKTAPKWLSRPTSVAFGFGGQLVTIPKTAPHGAQSFPITIHAVHTEPHIAERARDLSEALDANTLVDFCVAQCQNPNTRPSDMASWKTLQTLFHVDSRDELVELLGFSRDSVSAQVQQAVGALGLPVLEDEAPTDQVNAPLTDDTVPAQDEDPAAFFDQVPAKPLTPPPPPAEPFRLHPGGEHDPDRLITKSLILGDFENAVSLLVSQDRFADALVLATRAGDELLVKTQRAYFKRHASRLPYLRLLQSIVTEDLTDVVQNADLAEWQEIFVVLCTFARQEDFSSLAERLGQRLEDRYLHSVQNGQRTTEAMDDRKNAVLCYLAAGCLEKVMSMWIEEMREEEHAIKAGSIQSDSSPYSAHAEALQTLMEKVVVFEHAVQYTDEDLQLPPANPDGTMPVREFKLAPLYNYILEYVNVLAEQGLVDIALKFVALTPPDFTPHALSALADAEWTHDRLLRASQASSYGQPSTNPYVQGAYGQSAYGAYSAPSAPSMATAASMPSIPTVPTVPSVPTVPTVPTAAQTLAPPPTAQQQHSRQTPPVAQIPPPPPHVGMGTTTSTMPMAQADSSSSPYVPAYNTAAVTTAQPPQASAYTNTAPPVMQAPPPPPIIGAPPAGMPNLMPETQAPSMVPPPPLQREKGGWNDVPAATLPPPPKRVPSAASSTSAITSPFPNQAPAGSTPMSTAQGGPGAGPMPPPPPPPPRGPPMGGPPRPSSAASSHVPPSPRSGLGLGQPPRAADYGRRMQDGMQNAPGGVMRPQTPTVPGRPPMARTPNTLRPQMTGPPSQFAGQQAAAGATPRGFSHGSGMPMTPRAMGNGGPPQARGGRPGPPPRSMTPAGGGYGAPPPSSTPGTKPGFQYPRGDRSHIPPHLKAVSDSLIREVARLRSIDAQPRRILDDADKRVQLLLDLMNNGLVDAKLVPVLQQLGKAIDARHQQGALSLHVQLVTMATGDVATALVGVKFLIAKLTS